MSQRKVTPKNNTKNNAFHPISINPLTDNQRLVFDNYDDHDVISMTGLPGTGKTFLALYFALKEILRPGSLYHNLYIIRSDVSVRPTGFLPGSIEEKMAVHEAPYQAHCNKLLGRGDGYELLKKINKVEFMSTAHIRGIEFNNAIVLIDECQNMSLAELDAINTRFGENCKMIFCGDVGQDNLTNKRYQEESGYRELIRVFDEINEVYQIHFTINDIVRSGYLKKYILARYT